ncbi:hypothetical protein STEG23_029816, partial [Scotinomys teguina]
AACMMKTSTGRMNEVSFGSKWRLLQKFTTGKNAENDSIGIPNPRRHIYNIIPEHKSHRTSQRM